MNCISVSVPGKIMLAGEYAILKGGQALAATVNSYLTVNANLTHVNRIQDRNPKFSISSNLWPEARHIFPHDVKKKLEDGDPLLETVRYTFASTKFRAGNLHIDSQIKVSHGIGSSSAMRLGVLLALNALCRDTYLSAQTIDWDLVREGFLLQKRQQTFASGYDFATQAAGGLVLMEPPHNDADWPGTLKKYPHLIKKLNLYFHPFVGGIGAPTKSVTIETITWLNELQLWEKLKSLSDKLIHAVLNFLENSSSNLHFGALIEKLKEQRHLFYGAPHFPRHIVSILEGLPECDVTWSFKTTGAGGEDAILLLGNQKKIEALVVPALKKIGWQKADFKFDESAPRFFKDKLH